MPTRIPPSEIDAVVARLDDWQVVDDAIIRKIEFATFRQAIDAISAVAVVADDLDHHPDIDVRWRTVSFRCSTHTLAAVTDIDIELAAEIDRIAREAGVASAD